MTTVTQGQLVSVLPYGFASATLALMRTELRGESWAGRFVGSLLDSGGDETISGHTYEDAAPAERRVVIMTQPPVARIIYEVTTRLPLAEFDFTKLAPGNYLILDCSFDGSHQALVYDWVVAG